MPWSPNQKLRFRWDIFNLTNTPRFDVGRLTMLPDRATTFGSYNGRSRPATAAPAAACSSRCGTNSDQVARDQESEAEGRGQRSEGQEPAA